jgi:hypothetical protein
MVAISPIQDSLLGIPYLVHQKKDDTTYHIPPLSSARYHKYL